MSDLQVPAGMICTTTWGSVTGGMLKSWMEARSYSEKNGLTNCAWEVVPGTLVEKARNDAVRQMLQRGGQWLLMIDGDAQFAPEAILQLLHTAYGPMAPAVDVVGAYCVHGDTRILHRHGYSKIKDVVGHKIEVFNGQRWSEVTPFQSGVGRNLLRVTLSDGSVLECTSEHRFSVKQHGKSRVFAEVAAKDLVEGNVLPSFRTPEDIAGESEMEAYTYGAFLGDGAYYPRNDAPSWRKEISLYRGKHGLPVTGSRCLEQANGGVKVTLSHLDEVRLASLKADTLPEWLYCLDRESLLAFLAGWFDTDGTCRGVCGGGFELATTEARARGAQLLLRRAGFSYVSIRESYPAGSSTNYGRRHQALWIVRITGREAGMLPTHRLSSETSVDTTRPLRQVSVRSVEKLDGVYDTFCFTEPLRGMGVFGNALTFQCTLKGDPALPTIDRGDGTWQSQWPGEGPKEVIRTGAAFLLVKRHVFERLPDPWFRMRVPARPVDFMAEVDNWARIKMNGQNPFRNLPGQPWEKLEQLAANDPSSAPGKFVPFEVGEDSGFCDRVKNAGMRVWVDTNIVVRHIDTTIRGPEQHKTFLEGQQRQHRQLVGLLS